MIILKLKELTVVITKFIPTNYDDEWMECIYRSYVLLEGY